MPEQIRPGSPSEKSLAPAAGETGWGEGALMYPHRIRLRGPWECEPLARRPPATEPLPPKCRMTLPCRWSAGGLADFAGTVRFRRHFGWPARIDAHERVWLTFGGVEDTAEVQLNGQFLGRHEGASEPFEFEVTSLLGVRNDLTVEVTAVKQSGGIWGEVALEVRCTAFLESLAYGAKITGDTARLHVEGRVVGSADRSLELYLLLDNATVGYRTVEAVPEGQPFQLISDDLDRERWSNPEEPNRVHEVRIELVNGATVWYRAECPFVFRTNEAAL